MGNVLCVICHRPLPVQSLASDRGDVTCPSCRRRNSVVVFPALNESAKPPPLVPEPLQEGEAACFYNPTRKATKECGHCGVLVSDQWAAQWGSQTVCLKCLDHLRDKAKDGRFETQRTQWDNIALVLSLAPFTVVLWWAVFITAPAAVLIAFWHWKSQRSLIPRGRFRLVLGGLIGSLQIAAGLFLLLNVWFHWF